MFRFNHMNSRNMKYYLPFFLLLSLLWSCSDDQLGEKEEESSINQKVNKFLEGHFTEEYLWVDNIRKGVSKNSEPETYFNNTKYSQDSWSHLTNESETGGEIAAIEDGSTYGFGYKLTLWTDGRNGGILGAKINWVYPDSPAAEKKLEKGDFITRINGEKLSDSNCDLLYSGSTISITVEKKMNSQEVEEITMTSRKHAVTPILKDTILVTSNNIRIGYLCYTCFVHNGNQSFTELDNAFKKFKSGNIDELIVDLRFNGGGYSTVASYLASLIAPKSYVDNKEIWIKKTWNKKFQEKYEKQSGQPNLSERFNSNIPAAARINDLKRVWILGNSATASASEMLISGLKPFMKVHLIGTTTLGKYAGGIVYTPGDSEIKDWNAYFITTSYTNTEGESAKNGLSPESNHIVDGNSYYNDITPLGSLSDSYISIILKELGVPVQPATMRSRATDQEFIPRHPDTQAYLIFER